MDDVENFRKIMRKFRELIDDDFTESDWKKKSRSDDLLRSCLWNVKYFKMDYARQLIRRQHHKNKDCLLEYTEARASDIEFEDSTTLFDYSWRSFFAVELIYKCTNADLIEENDPIFLRGETLQHAVLGILLHTYVPFKCLKTVFHLTEEKKNSYFDVVARFMEHELYLGPIHVDYNHPHEEAEYLLAFVHSMWVHSSELGRAMFVNIGKRTGRQRVIQNALELQRAGIRFKGVKRPTFDIRFRQGLLEIPVLSIITETYDFLLEFIDYEENSSGNGKLVVSDYCVVMNCLIQSSQDVQLLRESGVIESYLHDDKDVVDLFDKVGKRVPFSTHFCYSSLFDDVNKHCVQTWNSWKAKFRRNYFRDDNQLEAASFMFAIYIILPVTVLQTVYTVLSYYKGGG